MKGSFRIAGTGLSHSYRNGTATIEVLSDVSFSVEAGCVLSVLGTNGSGKTTLLSCIAGLTKPAAGSVVIDAVGSNDAPISPTIGLLHQDYRQTNFPWASVLENVTYPLRFRGLSTRDRVSRGIRVLEAILPDVSPESRAYELSGGQQQLLALARALAAEPDILLGDEPLSAIDSIRGIRAIQEIEQAWQILRFSMIWISHDIDEALLLGDIVGLLSRQKRSFERLITNPVPKPRTPSDLIRPEMIKLKAQILEFLLSDSALPRDMSSI